MEELDFNEDDGVELRKRGDIEMDSRKKEKSKAELSRMFDKLSELSDEEFEHMLEMDSLVSDKDDKEAQQKRVERTDKLVADIEAHFPGLRSCFLSHNND